MKIRYLLPACFAALAIGFASCDRHSHGNADDDRGHTHEHGDEDGDHGHDHKNGDEDHDHGDDGHVHEKKEAGPNGGRLFTSVEPHFEFLVTDDRKVEIRFLEDDHQSVIAPAEQVISVVAGERANPTTLAFAKSGDALVSDGSLPDGTEFPAVIQIQLKPDAEMNREKFNLNLEDCPTCENLEYACVCGHHHHHHGSDHDHSHEGDQK